MQRKKKIVFILNLLASIFFFISAGFAFFNESDMALIYLGLGACFLGLFGGSYEKYKKEKDNEAPNNNQEKKKRGNSSSENSASS